jgi:hypothetical protein
MLTNEQIIAELNAIAEAHDGILRPEDVVQAASDPRSPLHPLFDWDDGVAAHKWRLHQARNLIRVCVRYIEIPDQERKPCRVFVSLSTDRVSDGGGYRALDDVLRVKSTREQLVADAMREAEAFARKYAMLSELAEVHAAISRALAAWRRSLVAETCKV